MHMAIARDSDTPLFRQIEAHLRAAIQAGELPAGTRLPSTRRLASTLGVSRITVENAYGELQADGLLEARGSGGTLVCPPLALIQPPEELGAPWPSWQYGDGATPDATLASPAERLQRQGHPDPIDFAGGTGDPNLFPLREFYGMLHSVRCRRNVAALAYGDPKGYPPLRQAIADIMASQGLRLPADNILITAGSQQAIALVARHVARPGQAVIVEGPTYAVALDLFRALGLRPVAVPMDSHGMRVDLLPSLLERERPGLIYTIPTFHNPTGICMSSSRRRQLLAIAARYGVPIVEDDYVGDLRFEGHVLPALKSLDTGGHVIYVGTFSKMLMPGLRTGFLAVDGPVYARLARMKALQDLSGPMLLQQALHEFVSIGRYQAYLRRSCRLFRLRRDAMLAALARHLPEAKPGPVHGGLFLWLALPDSVSSTCLLEYALDEGVGFMPGNRSFPDVAAGDRFLRLNFAMQAPDRIDEGIRRLGTAFDRLRGLNARHHIESSVVT